MGYLCIVGLTKCHSKFCFVSNLQQNVSSEGFVIFHFFILTPRVINSLGTPAFKSQQDCDVSLHGLDNWGYTGCKCTPSFLVDIPLHLEQIQKFRDRERAVQGCKLLHQFLGTQEDEKDIDDQLMKQKKFAQSILNPYVVPEILD